MTGSAAILNTHALCLLYLSYLPTWQARFLSVTYIFVCFELIFLQSLQLELHWPFHIFTHRLTYLPNYTSSDFFRSLEEVLFVTICILISSAICNDLHLNFDFANPRRRVWNSSITSLPSVACRKTQKRRFNILRFSRVQNTQLTL